jgi:hypothetical protein
MLWSAARRGAQDGQCGAELRLRDGDLRGRHAYLPRGQPHGLAKGKTPEAVEKQLEKHVPGPFRVGAHHWLILHGRYICKARTPECWRCPVVDLCAFKDKVLQKKK